MGSRGLGGFTELLVGSIAGTVAAHGECPVVVIRGGDAEFGGRPVLVGVDGSPAGEAAIAFAFEDAASRGVPLIALHTWSDGIAGTRGSGRTVAGINQPRPAVPRPLPCGDRAPGA